jgi:hypothetical protein
MAALFSHQIVFSTDGVRTTNLSLGERPVNWPVEHRKRAAAAQPPSPRLPQPRPARLDQL